MSVDMSAIGPKTYSQKSFKFTAKSGLAINFSDDFWVLLPNNGKGRAIKVGWVRSFAISERDRELIFEVLIHYVRTKAAATASGIVANVKPQVEWGIPSFYDGRLQDLSATRLLN